MDDRQLRRLAITLQRAINDILAGDPAAVATVSALLEAALAQPPGTAARALRRAFIADDRVASWVQSHASPLNDVPEVRAGLADRSAYLLRPTEGPPPLEISPPGGAPPGGADMKGGGALPEDRPRHLRAEMPNAVQTGRPLSVAVAIVLAPEAGAARLKNLFVPRGGATVTVLVSSPGLVATGDWEAQLNVPHDGNSDPHRFSFTGGAVGRHSVTVEAYNGGTYLGGLRLEISVEAALPRAVGREVIGELSSLAFEPGEVTLQVRRAPEGYRFQLLGDVLYPDVTAMVGAVDETMAQLVRELDLMAAGRSGYTEVGQVRERVKALGISLWASAVPEAVQRQYWEVADRVTSFTIASDHDVIPWELLYPLNGDNDGGFLAEQFPVVRRAFSTRRVMTLPVDGAAFVVPPFSPSDALEEVAAIRALLGGAPGTAPLTELADVRALVSDAARAVGILHFACHNSFTDRGSSISLGGGPWSPIDLAEAVQRTSLKDTRPLIFFNACRSAGEVTWFSEMSGWARSFVRAGAGAFVGSLWAVRSSAARTFAEAFYDAFVTQRQPLGVAALRARQVVAQDDGDPTWLAYTVYGNPSAVAAPTTSRGSKP